MLVLELRFLLHKAISPPQAVLLPPLELRPAGLYRC